MAERSRVAVLISGRGSNMAALIYASRAEDCPFEVALVTGDNPNAPGLELADAEGISVVKLPPPVAGDKGPFFNALNELLEKEAIDILALAGFMRIIPTDFLAKWEGRILNIHPSLLPRHKGLKTHEACLAAGDDVTGATVHLVTPELDGGKILGQVEVAVLDGDTPESLANRVLIAEHQLYPQVLTRYLRANELQRRLGADERAAV